MCNFYRLVLISLAITFCGQDAFATTLSPSNAQQYAERLLIKNKTITMNNLKINEAKQILFSFEGSAQHRHFKAKSANWAKVRKAESCLLLNMMAIITQQIGQPFDSDDKPLVSVIPPQGSGYTLPVEPSLIKNPKLRKLYEKAIEDNKQKAQRRANMHQLQMNSGAFFRWSERYLTELYLLPPHEPDLEAVLRAGKLDEVVIAKIIKSIKASSH
jgi:hypothetical protein